MPTPDANMGARGEMKEWKPIRPSGHHASLTLNDAVRLTSSQEVSLVSPSVPLVQDEVRKMTATSGLKCYELYGKQILPTSWARMLAGSLLGTEVWYSSRCVLTWRKRDTKSARSLFQLLPSTHRTGETGSGLLQTPKVAMPDNLKSAIPDAKGRLHRKTGSDFGMNLADQIKMLPTPNAREKGNVGNSKPRDNVESAVELGATKGMPGTKTGLKLQPDFVEWMMGYPKGWTELTDSKVLEMRLSRKSQQK